MNDLQLALLGLGALLVALVWGYNLWQERRHRRRAEQMLPTAAPDVLMAGQPKPGERSEPAIAAAPAFDPPREPALAAAEETPPEAADSGLPEEWADGRVDCLLRIEFVDAVPVAELHAELAGWGGKIDKPLQWLGLDARSAHWRPLLPQDAGAVTQLAGALQLADRGGAVSEATLAAFLDGMHRLAQRFAGLVELPDPAAVLAQARQLDGACAGFDLQLDLLVLPRADGLGEMPGMQLLPTLEAAGLRAEGARFVATALAAGTELFVLNCETAAGEAVTRLDVAALARLRWTLDVPRVADAEAFDRMLECAQGAAAALGGLLADARGHALSDQTIAALRWRIAELHAQMAQSGIPAGSLRALRLFS